MIKFQIGFLITVIMAGSFPALGANTWDGGGANNYWNTATNWDNNVVPTFPVGLTFAGSTRLVNTNDLTGKTVNGITFASGAGAFVINGNSVTLGDNIVNSSASTQTVNLGLVLNADRTIAANSGPVVLGGAISGGFNLIKTGVNPLTLNFSSSSYSTFQVNSGAAILGVNNAIPTAGTLNLAGGPTSLDLNGKTQTLGFLRLNGTGTGTVLDSVGGGLLKLGSGGVDQTSGTKSGIISVPVDLNGATRSFTILTGNTVTISGAIANSSGMAGLTKSGAGTLILSGTNSYNGDTTVSGGTLQLDVACLSSTNSVSISNGAALNLNFSSANLVGAVISNGIYLPTGIYSSNTLPLIIGPGALEVVSTGSGGQYPDPAEVPVASTRRNLSELDIFDAGQPKPFSFRNDYYAVQANAYARMSNTISQSFGHAPKMFAEEVRYSSGLSPEANQPLMAQYAQDRPEKMLLCHFNFQQIKVMAQPEFTNFFPGHWTYYPGSTLTAGITATDTNVPVASTGNFLTNNAAGLLASNSVIALIPLDGGGKRLWNQTEFAVVRAKNGNTLTLDRGHFRTSAASYPAGTYVAVLPDLYVDETNTYMGFNWSLDCPRDDQGRNCGDVFVAMMARWFETNQPLERIHGILADVFFFTIGNDQPVTPVNQTKRGYYDTDGDGLGDNGFDAQGFNHFGLGAAEMARKLRLALGPDRIICSDANGPQWTRLPHLLNGMESEGLARWNDPYAEDWSSNLNLYRYWNAHRAFSQSLSYVVDKLPTLEGAEYETNQLHLRRLAAAVTSILNIGITANGMTNGVTSPSQRYYELFDHLKNGTNNIPGWLGQPLAWMRPATNAANLFSGSAASWTSANATITQDTNEAALRIHTKGDSFGPASTNMTISYSGQGIPSGDLFIRFLMKADRLMLFPTNVYRYVTLTVNGRQVNTNTADALTAVASSEGYSECCFYYRKAGPATVTLNLTFEGPQDVWIKDFAVFNSTDVLARSFENGVVLANPENQPHTFNLAQLFPGRTFRRIAGNSWDDPVNNDGSLVSNTVTVAALDGLFLNSANTPPVLAALTNYTINAGQTVSFMALATDADLPTNVLTFTKVSGVGQIATNGAFSWRAPIASADSTNSVTLQVTDNGIPPASASGAFNIIVNPLSPLLLVAPQRIADAFSVQIQGPVGPDYVWESSEDLEHWILLSTNTPVTMPFDWSDTNTAPLRFYRTLLGP